MSFFAPAIISLVMQGHVAVTPDHRLGEAWWKDRHTACLQIKSCRIAFLGDSITQGWQDTGRATWNKEFAPLDAANFGYSGDRTEHVVWRLDQGELIPAKPELVVLMIGTNNVGHGSSNPTQTADGVRAILERIRKGSPTTKILLLGIFPRGLNPTDAMRAKVNEATALVQSNADDKHVFFSDIGYAFTYRDGMLKTKLMPDLLHLTPAGYEIWAKAIRRDVDRILAL